MTVPMHESQPRRRQRLLSEGLPSVRALERELLAQPSPSKSRKAWWSVEDAAASIARALFRSRAGAAGAVALMFFLAVLVAAMLFGRSRGAADDNEAITQIATIAQVMGGVYGILLAVVVFSVQLHAQREDENAFLVRYLIKKHHVEWLLAAAIAATVTNGVTPLLRSLGAHVELRVILVVDVVLVPVTLVWSLLVIAKALKEASARTIDITSDELNRSLARVIAIDRRNLALHQKLDNELKDARLTYDPGRAWWPSLFPRFRAEFALPVGRYVEDVRVRRLDELLKVIGELPPDLSAFITLRPGRTTDSAPALVVEREDPAARATPVVRGRTADALKLPCEVQSRIKRSLVKLFIYGRRDSGPSDLNEYFDRIGERLVSLSKDGTSAQFAQLLDRLELQVIQWSRWTSDLEVGIHPRWLRDGSQQFNGPLAFDLYAMVRNAVASSDRDKLRAVAQFAFTIIGSGFRSHNLRLASHGADLFAFIYEYGTDFPELADEAGFQVDSLMHSIFIQLNSRTPISEDDAITDFRSEVPYLSIALHISFRLLAHAMKSDRTRDALNFYDRIFEYRRFSHYDHHEFSEEPPRQEDVNTLHDYMKIAIVGWALRLLEANLDLPAAVAVLDRALKAAGPRHRSIAIWELYHARAMHSEEGDIDHRLGIHDFELRGRKDVRVGVPVTFVGGGEWRLQGLHALLLRGSQPHAFTLQKYFSLPPRDLNLWRADAHRAGLTKLVASPLLGIQEEHQAESLAEVLQLLDTRERASKVEKLRTLLSDPIDPELKSTLSEDVRGTVIEGDSHTRSLRALSRKEARPPDAITWKMQLPRALFVKSPETAGDPAHFISDSVINDDAKSIFSKLEAAAKTFVEITSVTALQEAIRDAVGDLRARGHSPNLLIIPDNESFIRSIFARPRWEVLARRAETSDYSELWENMHVLPWPYCNAHSLVVLDSARAIGMVPADSRKCDVQLIDMSPAEKAKVLADATAALTAADVPDDLNAVTIITGVSLTPGLVVTESDAMLAIGVLNSDGAYAMTSGEKVFHRPCCPTLVGKKEVVRSLCAFLSGEDTVRGPCSTCNPMH
jgi:hypothetical protein